MKRREMPESRSQHLARAREAAVLETAKHVDAILMVGTDAPIPEGKANKDYIFLMFAAFGGDIFRCAHACGVDPEEVTRLAESGKWMERIRALIELKKGDKGPDLERGISRATNFVQVNRWRLILDRLIQHFEGLTDQQLLEKFITYRLDRNGEKVQTNISFKILADISTAMEKTHWLTYQATLDAPQDRAARREKPKDDEVEEDLHAKIAKSLAGMIEHTPASQLQLAQDTQVAALQNNLAREAGSSPSPPSK